MSVTVPLVMTLEVDLNHALLLSIEIRKDNPSFISYSDTDGINGSRDEYRVFGYINHLCRYLDFLLIGLVQRHDEPEDARKKEEEYEYQKLLIQIAEQEDSDSTVYGLIPRHDDVSLLVYFPCMGVLAVSLKT